MKNSLKEELQKREFKALKDKKRVLLKWATGCGKSKMTIDLVKNALSGYTRKKPARILLVVAERAHMKNWDEELRKWRFNRLRMKCDIICYASLHKVKDSSYNAIILDESHHAFSEKRLSILETLSADYIYMLSATMPESKQSLIEDIFGKFTVSSVSLKGAIKGDILPEPKIYILEMELDNTVESEKIQIGSNPNAPVIKWEDRNRYIFNNTPCIIKCTQYQKYVHISNDMDYWKRRYENSGNQFHRNKWVNLGSYRKRFLGELKTKLVRKLIKSFDGNKRFVCFCASVTQANKLSFSNTISSKRGNNYNQDIINRFNKKLINSIYAVGMITEGMNLNDIQAGIIVQLDGKERLFVQKLGRSMRADSPLAYIFYFKGTQDEVYLKKALENIDMKYVKFIRINNLTQSNNEEN